MSASGQYFFSSSIFLATHFEGAKSGQYLWEVLACQWSMWPSKIKGQFFFFYFPVLFPSKSETTCGRELGQNMLATTVGKVCSLGSPTLLEFCEFVQRMLALGEISFSSLPCVVYFIPRSKFAIMMAFLSTSLIVSTQFM